MNDKFDENIITEASLSDSVVFQAYNSHAEMSTLIMNAIKDSIVITENHIEEQIMQIERTRISPLSDKVLEEFRNGNIVLIYANSLRVPQMLPFFATKMGGKIKVFVFVNNYGTISKKAVVTGETYLNIGMKDLYVLMEGAYTSLMTAMYPSRINRALGLMKISCSIYVHMLVRIFNKEYTISMDQDLYDKIVFTLGKYFLETVWGCTNKDIVFSYARSNINHAMNIALLDQLSNEYESQQIKTLDKLIAFIKEFSPRVKELNFRYFLQCFMVTYKPAATFGLECLPYFLFTIQSSMIGSFIVKQPIIADVFKSVKGMNNFYPELVKTIGI